jgi:bifunctional DNA-binding transcriptional regulator/antitoxin component of YhaV-PrlF toxin-antitoxin module
VRDALGLKVGDRVVFRVLEGRVVLTKVEDFLDLAGSVSVAPEERGTAWQDIKALTWRRRAMARR